MEEKPHFACLFPLESVRHYGQTAAMRSKLHRQIKRATAMTPWRWPLDAALLGCTLIGIQCDVAHAREAAFAPRWQSVAVSSMTTVTYPRDNFAELGRVSARHRSGTFDIQLLRGERWITLAREEAGALGLRAENISNVMRLPRITSTTVFATYSPADNELRVRVSRMEKRGDGTVRSYLADFTPHHGERWAAARLYLTPAEAADAHRPGNNPFARFRGSLTDPVFRNISWPAAQVAIGHAMRLYDAHAAIIAVPETRIDTRTEESGNLFRRRVETTTSAYVRPQWFIALPENAQPYGYIAAICVGSAAEATSCDAPAHVARSGISVARWDGGNLPASEELMGQWSESRSGWSVLSIALGGMTGALAMGLDPGFAVSVANAYDTIEDGIRVDAPAFSPATASTSGLAENVTMAVGHGSVAPSTPSSNEDAELRANLRTRTREPIESGFAASRQLFVGNCPLDWSESQCAAQGMPAGMLRRPENPVQQSPTRRLQAAESRCRQLGYSGAELTRCAALSSAPTASD